MLYLARWFVSLAVFLATPGVFVFAAEKKLSKADIEHIREELGINEFTAPSIEMIFEELSSLKPIPFEKVWRDLPEGTPQERAQLALTTGGVIGDGFLAVAAERQSRVEPVGRVLLRLARGLGVGDRVTRHSRSIIEKATAKKWGEVRQELVKTQAEVEAAMLALKDEELAHLVALGGWLRGVEITAGVVLDSYSPERARRLIQPELLDYFLDRVATLNPKLKSSPLGQLLEKNLAQVKALTTKPVGTPVELAEVQQVLELAREINRAAGER